MTHKRVRSSVRQRVLASLYWFVGLLLTVYVGVATPYRSEVLGADAWEHHRAIRVMAKLGWHPGNPTYATDEPSIRYSPYTVILAALCRAMRWDAYHVLSGAAVVTTALLIVGLFLFLMSYNRQFIALPVLLVIVLLYGHAPGYANTLALADLPWHQVNPSANAIVLCMLSWAIARWSAETGARMAPAYLACSLLLTFALLSHGMTGLVGAIGLVAVAISLTGKARLRLLCGAIAVGATILVLGGLWPCYDLLATLRNKPDPWYWYNPSIMQLMLTVWCVPCYIAAILALPYRRDPLVRFCLWGWLAVAGLTSLAVITKSATLARLPLPGLIFPQILVGYAAWRLGLLALRGWRRAAIGLLSRYPERFCRSLVALLLPGSLLFFGSPQLLDILRKPYLLRQTLLMKRPDRQMRYYDRYQSLLQGVGERDVIMGDSVDTWPVPSFTGRVVAANHLEFFTPGQGERWDDVARFFLPETSDAQRIALLRKYDAAWILLNKARQSSVGDALIEPAAIHSIEERKDGMVLLRASDWLAAREQKAEANP